MRPSLLVHCEITDQQTKQRIQKHTVSLSFTNSTVAWVKGCFPLGLHPSDTLRIFCWFFCIVAQWPQQDEFNAPGRRFTRLEVCIVLCQLVGVHWKYINAWCFSIAASNKSVTNFSRQQDCTRRCAQTI